VKNIRTEALLRLKLETGRKHQIRVQLAHLGSPIIGDAVYGGKPSKEPMSLAAVELEIDHPRTGKRMKFQIDPPKSLHPNLPM
jgi:23S rRNA pseudouridine1911/1915/1917 synthase